MTPQDMAESLVRIESKLDALLDALAGDDEQPAPDGERDTLRSLDDELP